MRRLLPLLLLVVLAACKPDPDVYGAAADVSALEAQATTLAAAPAAGPATVRGVIGEVCRMGCWFYLLDEEDLTYVDLDLGAGFVIPPDSSGRRVVVAGRLEGAGAERKLDADTVILY